MPNNQNNIEIRSEEVQEILTAVPNWMIRWGNTFILVILLALILISWFIKYPDIITANAVVTTQTPPEKIVARKTGKISHLLIKDGELVKKNTPIAIIENTANYKDVYLLKSIIDTIQLNKNNFSFPIDKLPILFLGPIESDYAAFENAYSLYILNHKLKPFEVKKKADRFSLSKMQVRLKRLYSQKRLLKKEIDIKQKDLKRYEVLYNKGIISAQNLESKQSDFLRSQRNYSEFNLSISQLEEAISNGKKTVDNTIYNKTKEELRLLKDVLQYFSKLKSSIKNWEKINVLKSNIDGKVTYLNFWHVNKNINAGDVLFTILPNNNEKYIAKIKAPTKNAGKIKLGQKVYIELENYPSDEFGVLNGQIVSISSVPNDKGFYLIEVSLPNKMRTSYNKMIVFKQEMKGQAEIITEDLRLIDRFFNKLKSKIKN